MALSYELREDPDVTDEDIYPLLISCYYDESSSLISELESRLPHVGPMFRNDNEPVSIKIKEFTRGKSVDSKIKSFHRCKDGRGTFQDLISNHAGEFKHRSTSKKTLNLFNNIICNCWAYPLEIHMRNHRQSHNELLK